MPRLFLILHSFKWKMDLSKRIPASEALCSCIKLNKVKSSVYLAVPAVLEEHPWIYSVGLKMYFPLYLFPCPCGDN